MICNLQKYAKSSWFPVDFLSQCHIVMQDIFFLSKLKTSVPPNTIYYRLWIRWNCFRHVNGFFGKNEKKMEKISLLCFESCCDVFGIEGEKGASTRTRPYSCSSINHWFGWLLLLYYCLRFDKNRFMGSIKEHPENGHFSLFGPRIWTLFRSKIFFVVKMKTKKII